MTTISEQIGLILNDVRTKEERDVLREQISELEAVSYRANAHAVEERLISYIPTHLAQIIKQIIESPELKDNPEVMKIFFKDLEHALGALPLLRISMAFKPTEAMITRLHEWTKKNLTSAIILDMSYDGSIFGGARIIFEGKYKEITLGQMITNVLEREKGVIIKMIK